MRNVFFLHNPKAGGTAVRSLFASNYNPGQIAPVFFNAPAEYRQNIAGFGAHTNYSFYSGHYGYAVYRKLRRRHVLVTNFRHPVSRIASLYTFWRHDVLDAHLEGLLPGDSGCVREAKELSFSEFIRSSNPDVRLYIENFHYRQLYRSPWEPAVGPRFLFWMIQMRISMMHWFYVAEFPELSLRLFPRAFPEAERPRLERTNVSTRGLDSIDEDDSRLLLELNRLDMAIYTHAVSLLMVRAKGLP